MDAGASAEPAPTQNPDLVHEIVSHIHDARTLAALSQASQSMHDAAREKLRKEAEARRDRIEHWQGSRSNGSRVAPRGFLKVRASPTETVLAVANRIRAELSEGNSPVGIWYSLSELHLVDRKTSLRYGADLLPIRASAPPLTLGELGYDGLSITLRAVSDVGICGMVNGKPDGTFNSSLC